VAAARAETIRYHQALYEAPTPAGASGWQTRPSRVVTEGLAFVDGVVHAYDLGAGSGRHTLTMAERLPAGSRVTAVDLLPEALDRLRQNAVDAGLADRIDLVAADLESFRFPTDDAGLVVAFSAVEHLTSVAAVTDVLARCRDATRPGGVHVVVLFADRHEVTTRGTRPAAIECPLTAREASELLATAYTGWELLAVDTSPAVATEQRDGERYELRATRVAVVARAPHLAAPGTGRMGP
jgi:SAM-dependent methyltransferase